MSGFGQFPQGTNHHPDEPEQPPTIEELNEDINQLKTVCGMLTNVILHNKCTAKTVEQYKNASVYDQFRGPTSVLKQAEHCVKQRSHEWRISKERQETEER